MGRGHGGAKLAHGCLLEAWRGAGGRGSGRPAYSQGVSWALAPVCPPGSLERPRSPVGHGAMCSLQVSRAGQT